jgi:hypothetical protein
MGYFNNEFTWKPHKLINLAEVESTNSNDSAKMLLEVEDQVKSMSRHYEAMINLGNEVSFDKEDDMLLSGNFNVIQLALSS